MLCHFNPGILQSCELYRSIFFKSIQPVTNNTLQFLYVEFLYCGILIKHWNVTDIKQHSREQICHQRKILIDLSPPSLLTYKSSFPRGVTLPSEPIFSNPCSYSVRVITDRKFLPSNTFLLSCLLYSFSHVSLGPFLLL